MCKHIEIFAALAAPFDCKQVRTRDGGGGRMLEYITARSVMNRLDDVLGPAGWWDEYQLLADGAVMCKLSIELPDGSVVTKADVGGMSETRDESDTEKSGFSDALKRAAVKYGVGRYLYGDGVPRVIERAWAAARREREQPTAIEHAPAVSGGAPEGPPTGPRRESREPRDDRPPGNAPTSGRGLFAWLKERDEKNGLDLLKAISDWGRDRGYPARMVQWEGVQIEHAYAEASRLLAGMGAHGGQNGHSSRLNGSAERRGSQW